MTISDVARLGAIVGGAAAGAGVGYAAASLVRSHSNSELNSTGYRLKNAAVPALVGAAAGVAAIFTSGAARAALIGVAAGSAGAALLSGLRTVDPYTGPENQRPDAYGGGSKVGETPPPSYTKRKGDLLPDLRPLPNRQIVGSKRHDGSSYMEFSTTTGNFGQAGMELSAPIDEKDVNQTVYNIDGSTRLISIRVSGMGEDDPHADEHSLDFDDYAKYELFEANSDGTAGDPARQSHTKMSFSIQETDHMYETNGVGRVNHGLQGAREVQGLSVGTADTYGAGLCGQTFDTSGLEPGDYVLRQTINPNHRFLESDYSNNVLETVITLHADGTVATKAVTRKPDYTPDPLPKMPDTVLVDPPQNPRPPHKVPPQHTPHNQPAI
jgi:hypothetical protein